MDTYTVTAVFGSGRKVSQDFQAYDEREALITFASRPLVHYTLFPYDEESDEEERNDTLLSIEVKLADSE